MREAMLPGASVDRLNRAFAQSTDNAGLKEAINAEWGYVQSMNKQDVRVERDTRMSTELLKEPMGVRLLISR